MPWAYNLGPMGVSPGTRLGPYEILAPAGAGGMGEVYRARDTRLGREVAIKVLPAHLAEDGARRQRFEREARAVSSLNHPHICVLHDIGHDHGVDFLVLEYLEGETLAQRLEKGALPVEQTLRTGTEIADALDKAHRQGVVHRDLKPGNIMLTKSGAKLMDFGLAKAKVDPAGAEASTTATTNEPITTEGTLVGTFHYMAPEQLEGKEADARSDIFAFGAVVYEMATGRRAFQGKTSASLIAAILDKEPPAMTELQPLAPPALERVVKTCLAKDPDERWQTAHDVKLQLRHIAEAGSQAGVAAPVVARRKLRERAAWAAAAVFFVVAAAFGVIYFRAASPEARVVRSNILPPENAHFVFLGEAGGPAAVSPDGRRLAFSAAVSGSGPMLWVRALDAVSAQPLAGTEGAGSPFWSPDSRFLGFFADGKLKKIDAGGGPALTLCDAPSARGGTWNARDEILFAPTPTSPIHRVSAAGGPPARVTELDRAQRESTHRWPHFLPDGRHFLYIGRGAFGSATAAEETALYLGSLDSKERRPLLLRGISNALFASGYLLFVRDGTLMAQAFDLKRLKTTGEAFPVADHVLVYQIGLGRALFSASQNGVLVYQAGELGAVAGGAQLMWFDREGKPLGSVGEPAYHWSPRLSPDGKRLATDMADPRTGNLDVWIYELARELKTRFTFHPAGDFNPLWSPDGRRVVFRSFREGHFDIYQRDASGAEGEEALLKSDTNKYPSDWSADGRWLAYTEEDASASFEIRVLPLFGDRKPVSFLKTQYGGGGVRFSPDGRWLAYTSSESGRPEVYLAPFPGPGGRFQVSTTGGSRPCWRRDAKELFYLARDNRLMAAEVHLKSPTVVVGAVRPLFQMRPYNLSVTSTVYDASGDGRRFLVSTVVEQKTSAGLTLVTNWPADLKKR